MLRQHSSGGADLSKRRARFCDEADFPMRLRLGLQTPRERQGGARAAKEVGRGCRRLRIGARGTHRRQGNELGRTASARAATLTGARTRGTSAIRGAVRYRARSRSPCRPGWRVRPTERSSKMSAFRRTEPSIRLRAWIPTAATCQERPRPASRGPTMTCNSDAGNRGMAPRTAAFE